MIKQYQITQSNNFAISHKKVRSGGHFWYAGKCQSFYKLVLSFLMEVARHVQNTQGRTLVIFVQYIKKNCCNYFVFHLLGSTHVHHYLYQFKILCVNVPCASEKIIMADASRHTSKYVNVKNAFHDVKLILYMAYPVARHLLKVISVFYSENLALLMVIIIHSIRKSIKKRNLETTWDPRWKATNSLKQAKRHRNWVYK